MSERRMGLKKYAAEAGISYGSAVNWAKAKKMPTGAKAEKLPSGVYVVYVDTDVHPPMPLRTED